MQGSSHMGSPPPIWAPHHWTNRCSSARTRASQKQAARTPTASHHHQHQALGKAGPPHPSALLGRCRCPRDTPPPVPPARIADWCCAANSKVCAQSRTRFSHPPSGSRCTATLGFCEPLLLRSLQTEQRQINGSMAELHVVKVPTSVVWAARQAGRQPRCCMATNATEEH